MSESPPGRTRNTIRLNLLLKTELGILASYEAAIKVLEGQDGPRIELLLHVAAGHRRAVLALKAAIHAAGDSPEVIEPVTSAFSDLIRGEGTPVGEAVALRFLAAEESDGLVEYQRSLIDFEGNERSLLEAELIPGQQKHVHLLATLLDQPRG